MQQKKEGGMFYAGHVYISAGANYQNANSNDKAHVPEGTEVRLQWRDEDGAISPVYTAKTHTLPNGTDPSAAGPGTFAFQPKPWTDENGKVHTFKLRRGVKIWLADGQTGVSGGTLHQIYNFPGRYPMFSTAANESNGAFILAGAYISRAAIFTYEEPPAYMTAPKDKWVEDPAPTGDGKDNYVSGNVWLETSETAGQISSPNSAGEPFMEGYKVVTTTLTDEGIQAVKALSGLTKSEQAAETKALFEANGDKFIDQTVVATTDADGHYVANFKDLKNVDYIYQFVLDPDGKVVPGYTPWGLPRFTSSYDSLTTLSNAPFRNTGRTYAYNVHQPLARNLIHEITITHFDEMPAEGQIATPGQELKIDTKHVFDPKNPVKVQWKDKDGKVVKTCDGVDSLDKANRCTFVVPRDLAETTTYTVELVVDGRVVAADSAVAAPIGIAKPGSVGDKYESKVELPGTDGQNIKFSAENLPEGLSMDETGKITGTPTKAGTVDVTVNSLWTAEDGTTFKKKYVIPITVTDTELPDGKVGTDYESKPVKDLIKGLPTETVEDENGQTTTSVVTPTITSVENLPEGLTFDAKIGRAHV